MSGLEASLSVGRPNVCHVQLSFTVALLFYCKCLPITFLANLNKLLFWKKLMVFDNPTVRWLATRRKDNMYALACKMNIDCDLMVTSRREAKSKVWQSFERSIGSYLQQFVAVFLALYCMYF